MQRSQACETMTKLASPQRVHTWHLANVVWR